MTAFFFFLSFVFYIISIYGLLITGIRILLCVLSRAMSVVFVNASVFILAIVLCSVSRCKW